MKAEVPESRTYERFLPAARGQTGAGKPAARDQVTSVPDIPIIRTRDTFIFDRAGSEKVTKQLYSEKGEGLHKSIVARRNEFVRQRRRRRWMIAVAVIMGVGFPPILFLYFIAWLVWQNKPKNKSMRLVKSGLRALEKNQTGIALKRLQEAHLLDHHNYDALYWLGMLLVGQRRYAEAIEALSIVHDHVPGLPEVDAGMLDAYYELKDYENAIYHAQRLLELDPYDLYVLLKLADCYEALGKPGLALSVLQHAPLLKRILDEPLKQIHYRLAHLYEEQGENERALEHYRRIYTSDSTFRDVKEKLEVLEAPAAK